MCDNEKVEFESIDVTAAGDVSEEASRVTIFTNSQSDPASSSPNSAVVLDDDDDSSNVDCEIVSVSSSDAESKWRNVKGPITRLNTLIRAGFDNPRLLLTRIFGMDESILPTNASNLWSIIFSILSEPVPRHRLRQYSTLDSALSLLSSATKILVLTGAGISVSCGIPDFRSRDGIYARLAKDYPDLSSPQAMFEMDFFLHNPYPFFKFAKEIFPGQFKPSLSHRFISLLEKKGKLLRNYTQNIDTLEQVVGITKVIQCHGSFATASCITCHYRVPGEEIREAIMSQTVPRCPKCCPSPPSPKATKSAATLPDTANDNKVQVSKGASTSTSLTSPPTQTHFSVDAGGEEVSSEPVSVEIVPEKPARVLRSRSSLKYGNPIYTADTIEGVMKPDIVFFGEGLPFEFHSSLQEDTKIADLVLVMGSSLKVRPVSHIPNSVPPHVPQILINRESLPSHVFDTQLLGDCDVILQELVHRLGWTLEDDEEAPAVTKSNHLKEVELRVPMAAAVAAYEAELGLAKPHSPPPTDSIPAASGDAVQIPVASISDDNNNKDAVTVEPTCGDEGSTAEPLTTEPEVEKKELVREVKTGTASSPIDVDKCSDDSCVLDDQFNVAQFLPEDSFTRILPNQYVFKGAEVFADYGMAEDCVQHEGNMFNGDDDEEDEDSSDCSSSSSSLQCNTPLDDTKKTPNGCCSSEEKVPKADRFMLRLLRQCHADPIMQHYLASKKNSGTSGAKPVNGAAEAEEEDDDGNDDDDDCVIVSSSSREHSPSDSPEMKRRKCDANKASKEAAPVSLAAVASAVAETTEVAVEHL